MSSEASITSEMEDLLVQYVHSWSKKERSTILNDEMLKESISRLCLNFEVKWTKGNPYIFIDKDQFLLEHFIENFWNKFTSKPGSVEEVLTISEEKRDEFGKTQKYQNCVSYEMILRFFKANPGKFFTSQEIMEYLGFLDGLDPIKDKRLIHSRKRSLHRYFSRMRKLKLPLKSSNPGREKAYKWDP